MQSIITVDLSHEGDVVLARRRARQIADVLGLDPQDQSRFATAVSEIARNAFQYAGGGRAEFGIEDTPIRMLTVRLTDRGPGIGDLKAILDGRYVSHTGMGVGIIGARRLTDQFEIRSAPGQGTTIVLGKRIPSRSPRIAPITAAQVSAKLQTGGDLDLGQELREQNKELMRSLEETRGRQVEIERLNRELEETNRGVVALYMELDERALDLARTADMKSRILSDISHEVRTPLNAILNISRLLMNRMDGDLSAEQERQIRMIRDSAMTVTELVSDLLELARMEAGKTLARVSTFSLGDLFAGLRGMFRPLATSDAVSVVFEDVGHIPELQTDEGKIGQILRNLISNALKFTERGEIRVKAALRDGDVIVFTVTDTGIGIAPENHDLVFQEFSQIENPFQRRSAGAGLGLPLSRKLAIYLGGSLTVTSELGHGATFTAAIPRVYHEAPAEQAAGGLAGAAQTGRLVAETIRTRVAVRVRVATKRTAARRAVADHRWLPFVPHLRRRPTVCSGAASRYTRGMAAVNVEPYPSSLVIVRLPPR